MLKKLSLIFLIFFSSLLNCGDLISLGGSSAKNRLNSYFWEPKSGDLIIKRGLITQYGPPPFFAPLNDIPDVSFGKEGQVTISQFSKEKPENYTIGLDEKNNYLITLKDKSGNSQEIILDYKGNILSKK